MPGRRAGRALSAQAPAPHGLPEDETSASDRNFACPVRQGNPSENVMQREGSEFQTWPAPHPEPRPGLWTRP